MIDVSYENRRNSSDFDLAVGETEVRFDDLQQVQRKVYVWRVNLLQRRCVLTQGVQDMGKSLMQKI